MHFSGAGCGACDLLLFGVGAGRGRKPALLLYFAAAAFDVGAGWGRGAALFFGDVVSVDVGARSFGRRRCGPFETIF